jgi:hypothetical protein
VRIVFESFPDYVEYEQEDVTITGIAIPVDKIEEFADWVREELSGPMERYIAGVGARMA